MAKNKWVNADAECSWRSFVLMKMSSDTSFAWIRVLGRSSVATDSKDHLSSALRFARVHGESSSVRSRLLPDLLDWSRAWGTSSCRSVSESLVAVSVGAGGPLLIRLARGLLLTFDTNASVP
jgi:hypothetical protein